MSDEIEKNAERVMDGITAMLEEWSEQTAKVKAAWAEKDYRRVLHHASGYRQAAQQHAHKLWFYTFWPKWILVAILIVL